MPSVRVLLVDDVADFRKLVRRALRVRGGFEVIGEAADGASAIEVAEREQPDIVVLDLGLPDLAGAEVIGLVRERAPRSKIVVFTGRDIDIESARSVEGYVRKDADVHLLLDVLEDVGGSRPALVATLELSNDLASASRARRFVAEQCAEWGLDGIVDDALVVVSELVTNAVVHAGSRSEVRMIPGRGILRIEVADSAPSAPDPQLARDDDEHGRGLLLIGMLSAAWGTEEAPGGGKVVWADLPVADQSEPVG